MQGLSIVKIAAAVFLVCIVITVAYSLSASGGEVSSAYSERFASVESNIRESNKLRYDAEIVSGADVINAIRGNNEDIIITVSKMTSEDGTMLETKYSALDSFNNLPSNKNYINPYAEFLGAVKRNTNGVISGIEFKQQKYVNDAVAQGGSSGGVPGNTPGDNNNTLAGQVTAALQALTTTSQVLNQNITNLNNKVSTIDNKVTGLSNNINVEVDMSSIEQSLNTVVSNLTVLQTSIYNMIDGGNSVTLTDLNTAISNVQSAIDALKSNGSGGTGNSGTVDLSNITTAIESLQTAVTTIGEQLTNLTANVSGDGSADNTGMVGDIATIGNALDELAEEIALMKEKLSEISQNVGGTP